MSDSSRTVRRRIEAQGFLCLDDATIKGINLGLRVSPAICMTWTAIGTLLASPTILWSLVPFALLGAILPGHPFDVVYHLGIRKLLGGDRLPPYPIPRRFGCVLAAAMISAVALAFGSGYPAVGYVLGGALTVAASVNVFTGFCLMAFVYRIIFGRPGCAPVRSSQPRSTQ